jgi:hypothetical protein
MLFATLSFLLHVLLMFQRHPRLQCPALLQFLLLDCFPLCRELWRMLPGRKLQGQLWLLQEQIYNADMCFEMSTHMSEKEVQHVLIGRSKEKTPFGVHVHEHGFTKHRICSDW